MPSTPSGPVLPARATTTPPAAAATAVRTAQTISARFAQWQFGGATAGDVLPLPAFSERSPHTYTLKGLPPRAYLQYESQTFGINLGWSDDASPQTAQRVRRWFVARPAGRTDAVRHGERVALAYGGEPSFLKYADREFGVNLDWSADPVYEWRILGGAPGTPVRTGRSVALFNQSADGGRGEFLVHFDRTVGGDIGWPSSRTWGEQLRAAGVDLLTAEAKKLLVSTFL